MGMLVICKFFRIKINGIEPRTGNILEDNLVVCFPTDTGRQIHLSAGQ
jgi:hypothetical protein